jgi:hypothetical protein
MVDSRYVKNKHLFPFMPPGNMPIPPVKENTQTFNAGTVTIGVEYRVLTDALVAAMGKKAAPEIGTLDDAGVSIHVFVKAPDGDLERLRFDCFEKEPHYHYISWKNSYNDHVFADPTVYADFLAWSLEMIRTRLVPMLEKADVDGAGQLVDQKRIEIILPTVAEAAYQASRHANKERISRAAFAAGEPLAEAR